MKKISHKIICLLLAFAVLMPAFPPFESQAATGSLTVPTLTVNDVQKIYTYTVPSTTDINSVSYSGQGSLVNKSLSGTELSLTISGQSFTENVTASQEKSSTTLLKRAPGNMIWRYSNGINWQINTVNKISGNQTSYDVTGHDTGGGVPYELPASPESLIITTKSHYTTTLAETDDKKWVGDTTGTIYPKADINFANWTMKSAAKDPLEGRTIYPTNAVSFVSDSAGGYFVYVDHKIDHENLTDITSSAPASIGTGGYVQGNNYAAPYVYTLGAKTNTLYRYGGTVSYISANPESEEPTPPPTYSITGDFDILPTSTIDYRDSFSLKPKNIVIPSGCTYSYHEYKITRDGSSWSSPKIYGQTVTTSYSYFSYPSVIGVGSHDISIKITANCADSGWIAGKTLTVNGPPDNDPPIFQVGWTIPNQWTTSGVKTQVIVGTQLDLVYLSTPAAYDPDGDSFTFRGFDFSSSNSWAQQIPSRYGESDNGFHRVTMDTVGSFCATGTMQDQFGLSASKSTCVQVIEPNPIPVITGSTEVVEGRSLTIPLSSSSSYSPVGRSINHSLDIWTNKKSTYTTVGTEVVQLDVFDSAGLRSLQPATHHITVKADVPPVAVLNVQSLGIRQTTYDIYNNSYTTDGDKIIAASYRYKYDQANDGFTNDSWMAMAGTLAKTTLKPTKVGLYLIEITVTEDYGKSSSGTAVLDTINQAPRVSFLVEGENEQPVPNNKIQHSAQDILSTWNLYQTNTTTVLKDRTMSWMTSGNKLSAGLGRLPERYQGFYDSYQRYNTYYTETWMNPNQDSGYGANTLSGYRAIDSSSSINKIPLLAPRPTDETKWSVAKYAPPFETLLRTNKTHILYESDGNLLAMNKSKIGTYTFEFVFSGNPYTPISDMLHSYVGASPFDFILKKSNLMTSPWPIVKATRYFPNHAAFLSRDFTGIAASNIQTVSATSLQSVNYEISDKTIYQVALWRSGSYDGIAGDSNTHGIYVLDIRSYDLFTGELIQSAGLNGRDLIGDMGLNRYFTDIKQKMITTKGDNLVMFLGNTAYEFDRYGSFLKKGVVSRNGTSIAYSDNGVMKACSAYTNLSELYRGPSGEWYGWEIINCGIPTAVNLVKITPNFTIAWRTKLTGIIPNLTGTFIEALSDPTDSKNVLMINPIRREVIIRSFNEAYMSSVVYYQAVNMDTGSIVNFNTGAYGGYTARNAFTGIQWNGNYVKNTGNTLYTVDGSYSVATGAGTTIYNAGGQQRAYLANGGLLDYAGAISYNSDNARGGVYVGDGIYLMFSDYSFNIPLAGISQQKVGGSLAMWLFKGTPTTNQLVDQPYKLGQFVSTVTNNDVDLSWGMSLARPQEDTYYAGMSFRMTDPRNRYALETNGTSLYVSKYINGARTVLTSTPFIVQAGATYQFRIKANGSSLQALVNGVPYLDVTDTKYSAGKFGPFSDKSYVDFSNISYTEVSVPDVEWLTNFAIWDQGSATAAIRIADLAFSDPENDPSSGNNEWTISHTPKFLSHQGVSSLNGRTLTSPALTFDKVGNYRMTLRAQDDPNPSYLYPNNTFNSYRKLSNEYWQIITVHRRPIAVYTTAISSFDKNVYWTDTSYDPDRWLSAANYSTEGTGINYQTTRGILERKYYYITPSGIMVEQKLVTPREVGSYTVGLAVKDEYGAWSEWVEATVEVTAIAALDVPPAAGFTISPATVYRGTTVTINSTASDVRDGGRSNLPHEYYIRRDFGAEILQSTVRTSWTHHFKELGSYSVRQVVSDSKGQTAQAMRIVNVINRKPTATIMTPASTNQSLPTLITVARPSISWTYMDADSDSQEQFQVKIYRYGGVLLLDSGVITSSVKTWMLTTDLPENQYMYAIVNVFDGYEWSADSAARYFYIQTNVPPVADFEWSPIPVWEGDTITLINESNDSDGDTLTYLWTITRPNGTSYTSTAANPVFVSVAGTYSVTLTASDGIAQSTLSRSIRAEPLELSANVSHTELWLTHHEQQGHETVVNPKAFYTGEIFVVSAVGSLAATSRVTASLEASGRDGKAIAISVELAVSGQANHFLGNLYDPILSSLTGGLPDGQYQIKFEIEYTNGVSKEISIPIQIIGHAQGALNVHRRQ